jgi:hypothetical protein
MPQQLGARVWLFRLLLFSIPASVALLGAIFFWDQVSAVGRSYLDRRIVEYALVHASERDKERYYQLVANEVSGIWDAVPEPSVGRVLQRDSRKTFKQAEMVANNACMRASRPYAPKTNKTYRIVLMGDSVGVGTAGREEDRIGDQIDEILTGLDVRIDGKPVEVYTLSIGSWTSVNEATYLTSRFSEYLPDLVLVLMVGNDIGDTVGVLGVGTACSEFSPEFRQFGSGVFFWDWPRRFGVPSYNLLQDDLGTVSRERWRRAFVAWKRVEELVDRTGGKMLFGLLHTKRRFVELVKYYREQMQMTGPMLLTNYFATENALPHDPHPNREGHHLMAVHYLHVLSELGWLPPGVQERLPELDPRLSLETSYPSVAATLEASKQQRIEYYLPEEIQFDQLNDRNVVGFLGGIYPGDFEQPLQSFPYGSTRSAFLLRRKPDAERLIVELEVPDFVELYPYEVHLELNGYPSASLRLEQPEEAGRHRLVAELPPAGPFDPAVEVLLNTDCYWTTINRSTMKSYRLIRAAQE